MLLLFSTIGILPSIHTFRFIRMIHKISIRKSRSHEAPSNAESGLAASNNEVSSDDEQFTKCSGSALVKEPLWANHTTAATCDSTSVGCSACKYSCRTKKNHLSTKTAITTANHTTFGPTEVSHQLSKCWILSTRDLAYWARRKVFRASARTKAVWAAV